MRRTFPGCKSGFCGADAPSVLPAAACQSQSPAKRRFPQGPNAHDRPLSQGAGLYAFRKFKPYCPCLFCRHLKGACIACCPEKGCRICACSACRNIAPPPLCASPPPSYNLPPRSASSRICASCLHACQISSARSYPSNTHKTCAFISDGILSGRRISSGVICPPIPCTPLRLRGVLVVPHISSRH